MNKLTIGMFGFGCVGQGLYHTLLHSTGFTTHIKKIVVKTQGKKREAPAALFSYNKEDILNDGDINVVVELIDDAEEAFVIVKSALQRGKHVITANKKMVALHLKELLQLQEANNVSLLYEGAVCGSIPIIRTLEEYFDNEPLHKVSGIFNGTTNYILTKTLQEGMDYNEALSQAQAKGFAETDPTSDVEGFDVMYKTIIVALQSFGVLLDSNALVRTGITNIKTKDVEFATSQQKVIKLLANVVKQNDGKVAAYILPALVTYQHALAKVDNEFNGVLVEGEFSGTQFFMGRGAGSYPTGAAVLSDVSALSYGYRYAFKKHSQKIHYGFTNNVSLPVFISSTSQADIDSVSLIEETIFPASENYFSKTGHINLNMLKQHLAATPALFVATI